jgi:hypothetical protein
MKHLSNFLGVSAAVAFVSVFCGICRWTPPSWHLGWTPGTFSERTYLISHKMINDNFRNTSIVRHSWYKIKFVMRFLAMAYASMWRINFFVLETLIEMYLKFCNKRGFGREDFLDYHRVESPRGGCRRRKRISTRVKVNTLNITPHISSQRRFAKSSSVVTKSTCIGHYTVLISRKNFIHIFL